MFKEKFISYRESKSQHVSPRLCSLSSGTREQCPEGIAFQLTTGRPGPTRMAAAFKVTHLGYKQISFLPSFLSPLTIFNWPPPSLCPFFLSFFLSNHSSLHNCFTVLPLEKKKTHPGTLDVKKKGHTMLLEPHSKSASCSRYCRARSKLWRNSTTFK